MVEKTIAIKAAFKCMYKHSLLVKTKKVTKRKYIGLFKMEV